MRGIPKDWIETRPDGTKKFKDFVTIEVLPDIKILADLEIAEEESNEADD